MSAPGAWMPFYLGDYLADTMHLETEEHGAYVLLIFHYWRNGPLPEDDKALASITKVERKRWAKDVGPVVRAFFTLRDGRLHHKRIDRELAEANKITDTKRAAANARWNKNGKQPDGGGDAPAPPDAPKPDMRNGGAADAYADAIEGCKTDARASALHVRRISQSQSPSPLEAKPLPSQSPREPSMPRRSDPPNAWMHLTPKAEVDNAMVTRPVVGGHYLDIAAGEVCDAAGINDANWRGDWKPLIAWLNEGFELHAHILPAIRRVTARPSYRAPRFLSYFDQAVRESRSVAA